MRWRTFGSEAILLDPVSGQYLQVNDTGLLIWESLDPPGTLDEIVDRVRTQVGGIDDDVTSDVSEFIRSLAAHRFVTTGAP